MKRGCQIKKYTTDSTKIDLQIEYLGSKDLTRDLTKIVS